MTREELKAKVEALMAAEIRGRYMYKDWPEDKRAEIGEIYGQMGADLFIWDLLDTPGVIDVVSEYIEGMGSN